MFLRKDVKPFAKKVWLASPTMNNVAEEKRVFCFDIALHNIKLSILFSLD